MLKVNGGLVTQVLYKTFPPSLYKARKRNKKHAVCLSLFEDHIIVHAENAIEFTKALLVLVTDFKSI